MWKNLDDRVRALQDATQVTSEEIAEAVSERTGRPLAASELRRYITTGRDTPKARWALGEAAEWLCEVLERKTEEDRRLRRRERAALRAAGR